LAAHRRFVCNEKTSSCRGDFRWGLAKRPWGRAGHVETPSGTLDFRHPPLSGLPRHLNNSEDNPGAPNRCTGGGNYHCGSTMSSRFYPPFRSEEGSPLAALKASVQAPFRSFPLRHKALITKPFVRRLAWAVLALWTGGGTTSCHERADRGRGGPLSAAVLSRTFCTLPRTARTHSFSTLDSRAS
jgi:hypothetical protein